MSSSKYDYDCIDGTLFLQLFELVLIEKYNYKNPVVAIDMLNVYKNRFAVDKNNINEFVNFHTFVSGIHDQNPNLEIGRIKAHEIINDYNQKNILIIDKIINFFKEIHQYEDLYLSDEYYEKIDNFKSEIKQVRKQFDSELEKNWFNILPILNEEKAKRQEKESMVGLMIGCVIPVIGIILFCLYVIVSSLL